MTTKRTSDFYTAKFELKTILLRSGYATFKKLSEDSGICYKLLNNNVNGRFLPRPKSINILARLLKISSEDLCLIFFRLKNGREN